MLSPWASCTARSPPVYGLTPQDHVDVCAPHSTMGRRPCDNPATGRHDFGLGVSTGSDAPEFALPSMQQPADLVRLSALLQEKDFVMLQFGAYT